MRYLLPAQHLPAYLDEMCFRFNNRKNANGEDDEEEPEDEEGDD